MAVAVQGTRDIPIAHLTRYPGNPRRGNVPEIQASVRRLGQYRSVVVRDTGEALVILAGNHTTAALEAEGHETVRAEVITCDDDEARRINLADNRLAELGGYDDDALAAILAELEGDFGGTGWDQDDLDELLGAGVDGGKTDPDDAPEPPAEPVTQPGDLWLLGPHRLLCGDSTDLADLVRLMGGETADMVFTDPPYNADYSSRVDKQRPKPWGGIANDALPEDEYEAFLVAAFAGIRKLAADGAAVYVWTDWHHYSLVERAYRDHFLQKSLIIWDKGHFGLGTYYRTQHELLLFGVNGSRVATWNAAHDERDVWTVSRDPVGEYTHPTQKPVELATRAISNSSATGALVLDLFAGSGTTVIGAHRAGRIARAAELDPRYCDVICQRFRDHTGIEPELEQP
jgi:site-specific DNA-methyltransferase (adenine-specific)